MEHTVLAIFINLDRTFEWIFFYLNLNATGPEPQKKSYYLTCGYFLSHFQSFFYQQDFGMSLWASTKISLQKFTAKGHKLLWKINCRMRTKSIRLTESFRSLICTAPSTQWTANNQTYKQCLAFHSNKFSANIILRPS